MWANNASNILAAYVISTYFQEWYAAKVQANDPYFKPEFWVVWMKELAAAMVFLVIKLTPEEITYAKPVIVNCLWTESTYLDLVMASPSEMSQALGTNIDPSLNPKHKIALRQWRVQAIEQALRDSQWPQDRIEQFKANWLQGLQQVHNQPQMGQCAETIPFLASVTRSSQLLMADGFVGCSALTTLPRRTPVVQALVPVFGFAINIATFSDKRIQLNTIEPKDVHRIGIMAACAGCRAMLANVGIDYREAR